MSTRRATPVSPELVAPLIAVGTDDSSGPANWAATSRRARAVQLIPFGVLCFCAVPLALMLPATSHRLGWLLGSLVLMALSGLIIVTFPWDRASPWWRHMPSIMFCLAVVMLRQATGGPSPGYGTILLVLPVIWLAVFGRYIDLVLSLVTVAIALTLPLVALEGYSVRVEIPRMLLTLMVAAALGSVLRSLIGAVRANDRSLRVMVEVSRQLHVSPDPRATLCQGLQVLTLAESVTLYEPDRDGLRTTASTSAALSDDGDDQVRMAVMESGESSFHPEPGGTLLHLAVGPPERPMGVLTAAWPTERRPPSQALLDRLAILGRDADRALQRAREIAVLDDQAHRDGLTGLANRRAWDEVLEKAVSQALREGDPLAVAILDLDHFKAYNDQKGHMAGDDLLRAAGAAWNAVLRSHDLLARWGGEEFAVLFPDTELDAAVAAVERMSKVTPDGQTFSAGVAALNPGDTAETLVALADATTYQAKSSGRDRVMRAGRFKN